VQERGEEVGVVNLDGNLDEDILVSEVGLLKTLRGEFVLPESIHEASRKPVCLETEASLACS